MGMDEMTMFLVFTLVIAASIGVAGLLWARSVVVRMTDIETTLDRRPKGTVPLPSREALHAWRVKTSALDLCEDSFLKPHHRDLIGKIRAFETDSGEVPAKIRVKDDIVYGTFEHSGQTHTFTSICDLQRVEAAFFQSYAYALADAKPNKDKANE
ncbi:MAG: hypothetical protein EOO38_15040 [Cytophagaceae bacterium]|nr:MAG: hypothetical protein EOO38_15040 [Cytophagaceae bacterium]